MPYKKGAAIGQVPTDPPTDAGSYGPLKTLLQQMKEVLEVRTGQRGDPLDRMLTLADLETLGLGSAALGNLAGGGGSSGGIGGGIVAPPTGDKDLTPPPPPVNFRGSAGFAYATLQWDPSIFSVGHGLRITNIYAVGWSAGQINGITPPPTFGDAVLYDQSFPNIYSTPIGLGVKYSFWAKNVSVDGVESIDPSGGVNGVIVQPGLIAGHDLAPLIIEADKLAGSDFSDKVANGDMRAGAIGWIAGIPPQATFDLNNFPYWSGYCLFFKDRDNLYDPPFPVTPGQQFRVRAEAVPSGGGVSRYDISCGLFLYSAAPTKGLIGTPASIGIADTEPASASGVRKLSGSVTIPAGVTYARFWFQIAGPHQGITGPSNGPGGFDNGPMYMSRASVEDMADDTLITPSAIFTRHLSAGSIAAGSGAIGYLAVREAIISDGRIDDALVVNLSATKLTVGDGTIGGNLKSAVYSPSLQQGWLITPGGAVDFQTATIRGTIYAAAGKIGGFGIGATQLYSEGVTTNFGILLNSNGTGQIGGFYVGNTFIQSGSYVPGSAGWNLNTNGTGQLGGLILGASYISSPNWNNVFGPGGTGFAFNSAGDFYLNNVNARGNIEATSIKAGTANIVDTLMLQGGSIGVFRFQKGPDAQGGGVNGIFVDIPVTATDLATGAINIFVQGTISFSAGNRFSMGYTFDAGGSPAMPPSPGDGNLYNGSPIGGIWTVGQSILAVSAGVYRVAIWVSAGAIGATNPGVLSVALTAQFGRRNG